MASSPIPYGRQLIEEEDIRQVVDVLRSDFLTQGPLVPRFEHLLSEACGAPHVVAVNSATSALHIACLALGVGPGDLVWTSPNTFVASANCARYCGADVDFVDIEAATGNMSVEALAAKLEIAKASGRLPKVLIPVHYAGFPCEMATIAGLATKYGVRVVEDASHAIGATYRGTRVGDCQYSDATVFSFHPVKVITTGEGGAIAVRSPELASRLRLLRSHGIARETGELMDRSQGAWYYEQLTLGYNYRMTDMQAALGCSQLGRLEAWISVRNLIADKYDAQLGDLPLILPPRPADGRSAFHLYVVRIRARNPELARRLVFEQMRSSNILVNVHYIPVHLQPYYRMQGFKPGDFPVAEAHYACCLSLPLFPALDPGRQSHVISNLKSAMASIEIA
jgi:UDP-4-amino-4,6-dideoxy-N-acetyl-beta-L-altrosamine transaminase